MVQLDDSTLDTLNKLTSHNPEAKEAIEHFKKAQEELYAEAGKVTGTTLDDSTLDTMNKLMSHNPQDKEAMPTTTLDDPAQNALNGDDDIGTVDWDAKESFGGTGGYTPQVYPGVHNFLFALEDVDPFETREYDTKAGEPVKDFTVNHKGTVSYTSADGEPKESTIRFNRAGFHRSQKMIDKKMNSRGGELLRTLSINLGNNLSKANVEQALREADGKVMGRGVVNWEAYCKDDKQVVSTNANTKRGDARWPKGADGKYITEVQCPKCGATLAGRERITDYKLPQG